VSSHHPVPSGPLPREQRVDAIRAALERALSPSLLEIRDDSHRHAGHAGARDGRGHFHVEIAATAFAGQSPLQRHRAVYAALGELMATDIHALSIDAREERG
jgi:BolA family transcriptional regulator, general stress-responsive regulator